MFHVKHGHLPIQNSRNTTSKISSAKTLAGYGTNGLRGMTQFFRRKLHTQIKIESLKRL